MNVSSVVNHYPTANKGFITTLGSTISAGATTVPLTSVSGLTNGTVFVGLIEPGLANEQEFTGTVDTAGVQITGVKWTDGTNVDHTAGVTIVDYVSATGQNMQTKAHLVSHDQDGTLKAGAVDVAAVVADAILSKAKLDATMNTELNTGWVTGVLPSVSTVTANGNRSYDITFGSSVASTLSSGMRLRTERTVAAPTTCFSLDGTNDYYNDTSVAGMTFTDDFCAGGWVKLSAYGSGGVVISRYNGTSGWSLIVGASGEIRLRAYKGSAANISEVISYQSVPLNKWVHIAAQLDMSAYTATTTTSYIMLDGVNIPAYVGRAGTNPTDFTQAGNLEVGSQNGGTAALSGKITDAFVSSAKITQANIATIYSKGLTASDVSTHSMVSAYTNGSTTDLNTTNANNLTAQNGATTATSAPYGNDGVSSTLDYALVMSVSGSTATVQVPEGCTIPTSGGVTSVAYSVQGNPYGWVSDKGRWEITNKLRIQMSKVGGISASTWYNISGSEMYLPVGSWELGFNVIASATHAGVAFLQVKYGIGTTTSSVDDDLYGGSQQLGVSATESTGPITKSKRGYLQTAAGTVYGNVLTLGTSVTALYVRGEIAPCNITAVPASL